MIRRSSPSPVAPAHPRSPLAVIAVLGLVGCGLLLSACGGSTPASGAANSEQSSEEAKLTDFARCLREHGVNAEAVTHGPGGGNGLKVSPESGGAHGPEQFEAAEKACRRYQPKPQHVDLSPQQKVEQEEAVQKFAKCMREHGIKVEASTQGGGVSIHIHAHPGEAGAPNPESPAFQSAQQSCQKLLPNKGPGTRTGGPAQSGAANSSAGG